MGSSREVRVQDTLLDELVTLAHALGLESRALAILGEGNVSVKVGDDTFLVKASGSSLGALGAGDVSRVRLGAVLAGLERPAMSEEEVETFLRDSLADPGHKKPSVETFLHALCLTEGGALWVGHTHTVSVNGILCSQRGAEPFRKHIFPDAVVVCGRAPAVVPYLDPGFALAKGVQQELRRYKEAYGRAPKLLLMENHGPVALAQSAKEVFNIMLMADKWAKTLLETFSAGGPRYLSAEDTLHIDNRLDEHYRRRELTRELTREPSR